MLVEPLSQIGLAFRVMALIIMTSRVLPHQYKEFKLGNGLKFYRGTLFALGVAFTFSIVIAIYFVLNRIYGNPARIGQPFVSITYAISDLILSSVLYLIYNKKGGEA